MNQIQSLPFTSSFLPSFPVNEQLSMKGPNCFTVAESLTSVPTCHTNTLNTSVYP